MIILMPVYVSFFQKCQKRKFDLFYFYFYILLCFLLTLSPIHFGKTIYFTHSFNRSSFGLDFSFRSFFLNLSLCFPLGYFLKNKTVFRAFLIGFAFGMIVELTQLIFPLSRVFDPLDMIFCGMGALISSLFYKLVFSVFLRGN